MFLIGLVGGIASGKSLVAQRLAELGAVVLDADRVGHAVLEQRDVREALAARWGDEILDDQARVRRAAVARRVFSEDTPEHTELRFLESIMHPRIRQRLEAEIESHRRCPTTPVLVLDAPLMLEAGWDSLCQEIWFVEAPRPLRLERARQVRGWSEAEFAARERAQWPLERKRARAHRVIDNSGTPETTRTQVDRYWQEHILSSTSSPHASDTDD